MSDPSTYLRALHRDARKSLLWALVVFMLSVVAGLSADPIWRVLGTVAAIFAAMFAAFAVRQMIDPRKHPSYERLRGYGDPEGIACALSAEMERGTPILGATVGREWLVIPGPSGLDGILPADVVGVFHRVLENWPGNLRWHDAVIVTRRGELTVRGRAAEVEALVQAVHAAAPWAMTGDGKELRALYRSKDLERAIQQADARRLTMLRR
jgi:hypothetical protein